MSDISANLALPYMAASQAQKHVTHNEALQILDAVVQLGVADRDRTEPPAAPEAGARHVVAPGATGAWAGQDGRLALWTGNAWMFIAPQTGWRAWVVAENADIVWHDGLWQPLARLDNVPEIGINTSADTFNRLAVCAPATLLNHEGAGHQLKINKAIGGETGSVLFQTGFAGRAEMGLMGNDDFSIKVTADGVNWREALRADAATGGIVTGGIVTSGPVTGSAVTQGPADATADRLIRAQDGYVKSTIVGSVAQTGGVPTGAVIERGANATGEYVRFADGTQTCIQKARVDVTSTSSQVISLATSFVGPVGISVSHLTSVPNPALRLNNFNGVTGSADKVVLRLLQGGTSVDPASDAERLVIFVSGRWF